MGIVIDSSVLVGSERSGRSVEDILEYIESQLGEKELGVSAITIGEMVHGVRRARPEAVRRRREAFLEELVASVSVLPIALGTARIAGEVDGDARERGVVIPFADLWIGVTALELGFAVATANVRHFRLIPGLVVRLVE